MAMGITNGFIPPAVVGVGSSLVGAVAVLFALAVAVGVAVGVGVLPGVGVGFLAVYRWRWVGTLEGLFRQPLWLVSVETQVLSVA